MRPMPPLGVHRSRDIEFQRKLVDNDARGVSLELTLEHPNRPKRGRDEAERKWLHNKRRYLKERLHGA